MAPVWVLPTVIIISLAISLGTQLVNYFFIDQELMKKKRKEMTSLQKSLTPQSTKEEINKVQNQIMSINNELMKQTMKPTMYTLIPLLVLFWGMSSFFKPYGDLVTWGFELPIFGPAISWLGTYFISSMIFSMALRPIVNKIGDKIKKVKKVE